MPFHHPHEPQHEPFFRTRPTQVHAVFILAQILLIFLLFFSPHIFIILETAERGKLAYHNKFHHARYQQRLYFVSDDMQTRRRRKKRRTQMSMKSKHHNLYFMRGLINQLATLFATSVCFTNSGISIEISHLRKLWFDTQCRPQKGSPNRKREMDWMDSHILFYWSSLYFDEITFSHYWFQASEAIGWRKRKEKREVLGFAIFNIFWVDCNWSNLSYL